MLIFFLINSFQKSIRLASNRKFAQDWLMGQFRTYYFIEKPTLLNFADLSEIFCPRLKFELPSNYLQPGQRSSISRNFAKKIFCQWITTGKDKIFFTQLGKTDNRQKNIGQNTGSETQLFRKIGSKNLYKHPKNVAKQKFLLDQEIQEFMRKRTILFMEHSKKEVIFNMFPGEKKVSLIGPSTIWNI